MLESFCHTENAFVTLTYSDDNLPLNKDGLGTLRPDDMQAWLKRFRVAVEPRKVRFYGVGEYGENTFRPHYHVCVFGVGQCARGRTLREFGTNVLVPERCCEFCSDVYRTWGHGIIEVGELNAHSAGYIAQYTVKKMTRDDDVRLGGRHPEFARMSLRPGIGADAMWQVASDMFRCSLDELGDVPGALAHGRKKLPLGRYLMNKLRVYLGKEEGAPDETLARMAEEMLPLRLAARQSAESLSKMMGDQYVQYELNEKAKMEIHKRRKI